MNKLSYYLLVVSLSLVFVFRADFSLAQAVPPQVAGEGDGIPVVETAKPEQPKEKIILDPATQKKLRNDMVYRVNLGRASDVQILIEKGASVDELNDSGVPIIALASARPDNEGLEMVKVLVEAGADINKTDKRAQNALFYAAKSGNKTVVEYLLSKKIFYTSVDKFGNTARVTAYQAGHHEVVEAMDKFVQWQNEVNRQKSLEVQKNIDAQIKDYSATLQQQTQQGGGDPQNPFTPPEPGSVQDITYNLSFSSCAATYWQFCNSVKQPTEFSNQELQGNINAHTSRVKELSAKLAVGYKVSPDVTSNIISVTEEKVRAELTALPSNEARREESVGTINDMNRRCSKIASIWETKVNPSTDRNPVNLKTKRPSIMPSFLR